MLRYAALRLGQAIAVAFALSGVVFLILRLIPGDPALTLAGFEPSPETLTAIRHELHLDEPLPNQYARWLAGVVQGDLGKSYINQHPVRDLIGRALPATVELALVGMVVALLIGITVGLLGGARPNSRTDAGVSAFVTLGYAVPNFILGLVYILVFAVWTGWLPPGGFIGLTADPLQGLRFLVLPAVALALPLAATQARFTRAAVRDILREDYIRTATAKGLHRSARLLRHALPNAAPTLITVAALQFGQLLGGAVIVESVFAWPGVGRLLLNAVLSRDYVVVQGVLLLLGAAIVIVNLVADLAAAAFDPRIRTRVTVG